MAKHTVGVGQMCGWAWSRYRLKCVAEHEVGVGWAGVCECKVDVDWLSINWLMVWIVQCIKWVYIENEADSNVCRLYLCLSQVIVGRVCDRA